MKGRRLTHLGRRGEARMVDVSTKAPTERVATAEGRVIMHKTTLDITRMEQDIDKVEDYCRLHLDMTLMDAAKTALGQGQ